jgi:hypothetical protein
MLMFSTGSSNVKVLVGETGKANRQCLGRRRFPRTPFRPVAGVLFLRSTVAAAVGMLYTTEIVFRLRFTDTAERPLPDKPAGHALRPIPAPSVAHTSPAHVFVAR